MRIEKLYTSKIDMKQNINTAAILDEEHFVLLTDKGDIIVFAGDGKEGEILYQTNAEKGVAYPDGGFDPAAESSFHIMDNYIVIANDYKTHAFLLNIQDSYILRLQRESYYTEYSKFPIAFCKGEDETPLLLYSNKWNRVDIVNLHTRQILTADARWEYK